MNLTVIELTALCELLLATLLWPIIERKRNLHLQTRMGLERRAARIAKQFPSLLTNKTTFAAQTKGAQNTKGFSAGTSEQIQ